MEEKKEQIENIENLKNAKDVNVEELLKQAIEQERQEQGKKKKKKVDKYELEAENLVILLRASLQNFNVYIDDMDALVLRQNLACLMKKHKLELSSNCELGLGLISLTILLKNIQRDVSRREKLKVLFKVGIEKIKGMFGFGKQE